MDEVIEVELEVQGQLMTVVVEYRWYRGGVYLDAFSDADGEPLEEELTDMQKASIEEMLEGKHGIRRVS